MATQKQLERKLVRRPSIKYLRHLVAYKQLRRYPFIHIICPPDLGKLTPAQAGQMKLDGYDKGVFDMTLVCANKTETKVFLIEFKYGKGKYTDEQEQVARDCDNTPITALKIYSYNEFITFIDQNLK